jgi:hypothetical protein
MSAFPLACTVMGFLSLFTAVRSCTITITAAILSLSLPALLGVYFLLQVSCIPVGTAVFPLNVAM